MSRRGARATITAAVIAGVIAMAGCAPTSTGLDTTVSAQLEQTVLVITQSVAADDWLAADRDLDVLEAQVEAAVASGTLSDERAAEIREAIALVRADVAASIEQSTPSESPEPTETDEPEKPGNRGGNRDKNND